MNLKLAILFGGQSVEHEISIISAVQAMAALNTQKTTCIAIYLSKDHRFYTGEALKHIENYRDLKGLLSQVDEVSFQRVKNTVVLKPNHPKLFVKPQVIDMVLPIVHGTFSEDGTIVGFLETLGIPYIGSDGIASAIGQDKAFMKMAFEHAGLPIIPWFYVLEDDYHQDSQSILNQAKTLQYPLIIKPARLGSSIGIQMVQTEEQLSEALEQAFYYDHKLVIEKAIIKLREVNCSVCGDASGAQASVLEEVGKSDEILSYQDKYQSGSKSKGMASLDRIIPAPLDVQQTTMIQELALTCFKLLNNKGVARIDFIIDESTHQVYVNEINTIPGSLSFYLWDKSGVPFDVLLDKLIQQGIQEQRRRSKRITSFDTNILSDFKLNRKQKKI